MLDFAHSWVVGWPRYLITIDSSFSHAKTLQKCSNSQRMKRSHFCRFPRSEQRVNKRMYSQAVAKLLAHSCWFNLNMSREVFSICVEGIDKYSEKHYSPFFAVINALLELRVLSFHHFLVLFLCSFFGARFYQDTMASDRVESFLPSFFEIMK